MASARPGTSWRNPRISVTRTLTSASRSTGRPARALREALRYAGTRGRAPHRPSRPSGRRLERWNAGAAASHASDRCRTGLPTGAPLRNSRAPPCA
jgi:hypothetical protein